MLVLDSAIEPVQAAASLSALVASYKPTNYAAAELGAGPPRSSATQLS